MGCDIHWILEQKTDFGWIGVRRKYDERVITDQPPKFEFGRAGDRNYHFFAALCGVRGDGPEPKGFPDDASTMAQYESRRWEGDGHSHSWETLEDYARLWLETHYNESFVAEQMQKYMTTGDKPDHRALLFEDLDEETEYRVLFFFDN